MRLRRIARSSRACCAEAWRGRAATVLLAAALAAASCARAGDPPQKSDSPGAQEPGSLESGGLPGVQAPADDDAIVTVVAEDAIAALDTPVFAGAEEAAAFMRPEEPVLGVVVDGQARAYSLWHLDRHEIVNDRAGDAALVVAWCPIAYTARVFRSQAAGRALTFGVSGRLWRNALVMRDRETGTLWSQVSGAAIQGPLLGAELLPLPAAVSAWSEWASLHPHTRVLRKPPLQGTLYPLYFADAARVGFYGRKKRDPRLEPKALVMGAEAAGRAVAVPLQALRGRGVWNDRAGNRPLLMVSLGGGGPELVFERRIGARLLSFDPGPKPRTAQDRQTGSLWDLREGRALSGPLAGSRLTPFPALMAYWFVWSAFHPQTEVRQTPAE